MKLAPFTNELLNNVDQERHYEALYTLRHSWAAREMFATAQMVYAIIGSDGGTPREDGLLHNEVVDICGCLQRHSAEILRYRWWRRGYHNPFRIFPPSAASFLRLIEELNVPSEKDEWGDEDLCRTILGWWQY